MVFGILGDIIVALGEKLSASFHAMQFTTEEAA